MTEIVKNTWFIGITSGVISAFLVWLFVKISTYYSKENRWKRKRLYYFEIAIKNLIDRFNISYGSGHPLGPIMTYEHYIWILYEHLCVINNWDSKNNLTEKEFKSDAEEWFNSYKKENMENAIMPYTIVETANLMCKVQNKDVDYTLTLYIDDKIEWLFDIPHKLKMKLIKMINWWNNLPHSRIKRKNDILYSGSQIPTGATEKYILKHLDK